MQKLRKHLSILLSLLMIVSLFGMLPVGAFAAGALTGNETVLEAGVYRVDADVTFDHNVSMNGDVELILGDGATMTIKTIFTGDHTLTISGGAQNTGKLVSTQTDYASVFGCAAIAY